MASMWLWIRWSWRDLRRRWLVVMAIALIIAVGSGVYAGFTSMATWRRQSNDLNYGRMHMYDLRVRLSAGTFADAGALRTTVASLPNAEVIGHAEERLIVPVQVDVTGTEPILVHGELVGIDLTAGGPFVNALGVTAGRPLGADDNGRPVALLHPGFAGARDLPPTGTVQVGGGPLDYVGLGLTPDYFMITSRAAGYIPLGNLPTFATLFTSLPTAQAVTGQAGHVNDLVLTLRPGADRAAVKQALEALLPERLHDVSATVTTRDDDEAYRILYDDIDNDQRTVNIIAVIVFGGAALAAFNLTSRLVEAQRREIGTGMALGVPPVRLAIRPLLFGAQVAVLGILAGIPIGLLVGQAIKPVLQDMVPLPVWQTPFQFGAFAQAAALGFVLPFLATAYPVLRAVRVQPVEAIRAGYLAGRSSGLAPLLKHVPLLRRGFAQMPVRNLLRTPRRTLLTAISIGAAVTALVGTVGLIDTFNATIDRGAAETAKGTPDRLELQLDFFYPRDSEQTRAVAASPAIIRADFGLRMEGLALAGNRQVELMLELLDFSQAMWTPSISEQAMSPASGGIVLAEKAAADLGVRPGDAITLRHARREGAGYQMVETPVVVAGLHPSPLRFTAFLDLSQAALFGLDGFTNAAQLRPAPSLSADAVQRALFGVPGVALVQPVSQVSVQLKDAMSQYYDILTIAEGAALAIALLIGFNATSISADERARDHATMFAFGLPVRTVLRINVLESALLGLLGTLIGIPTGLAVLNMIVANSVSVTLPEIGLEATLARSTILTALMVGVVTVAIGPLLTIRRLRHMDIPATLRVME